MTAIRWMQAPADRQTIVLLAGFDHRQIVINGQAAVLISYSSTTSPDRGVLAVFHPAAGDYLAVPDEIQQVVGELSWMASSQP